MDAVHDLAEQDTDEMRQEIDCTRSAMADKLEALENRVMGTVQNAQETVEDSIQMARDTVATVKRNFDIKYQVERHPWAMVGGCFLAGLALGGLFLRGRRSSRQAPNRRAGDETPLTLPSPLRGEGRVRGAGSPRFFAEQRSNDSVDTAAPPPRLHSMAANRPGFFGRFQEEIDKVKGMAIGYVMGLARDSIKDAVPQLASQIDDVMNSVTTKLGSKPVQQRSP
jgi:ElaB/YqjD/DUF883 family membrane-anchored ribosome-binding protein